MVYIAQNVEGSEKIQAATKKTFFQLLSGKNALMVGVIAGAMVFCSVGFVILLGIYLSGK